MSNLPYHQIKLVLILKKKFLIKFIKIFQIKKKYIYIYIYFDNVKAECDVSSRIFANIFVITATNKLINQKFKIITAKIKNMFAISKSESITRYIISVQF